jgi:hypothetical protein
MRYLAEATPDANDRMDKNNTTQNEGHACMCALQWPSHAALSHKSIVSIDKCKEPFGAAIAVDSTSILYLPLFKKKYTLPSWRWHLAMLVALARGDSSQRPRVPHVAKALLTWSDALLPATHRRKVTLPEPKCKQ